MAAFLVTVVTAPGEIGFCHRRWALDPRYVRAGKVQAQPSQLAERAVPVGFSHGTSAHLLERPSALAARACTIVN